MESLEGWRDGVALETECEGDGEGEGEEKMRSRAAAYAASRSAIDFADALEGIVASCVAWGRRRIRITGAMAAVGGVLVPTVDERTTIGIGADFSLVEQGRCEDLVMTGTNESGLTLLPRGPCLDLGERRLRNPLYRLHPGHCPSCQVYQFPSSWSAAAITDYEHGLIRTPICSHTAAAIDNPHPEEAIHWLIARRCRHVTAHIATTIANLKMTVHSVQ